MKNFPLALKFQVYFLQEEEKPPTKEQKFSFKVTQTMYVSCSWYKKNNYGLRAQFKIKEGQKFICTKFSTFHSSREPNEEGSNALDKSQEQTEKNRAKLNQDQ